MASPEVGPETEPDCSGAVAGDRPTARRDGYDPAETGTAHGIRGTLGSGGLGFRSYVGSGDSAAVSDYQVAASRKSRRTVGFRIEEQIPITFVSNEYWAGSLPSADAAFLRSAESPDWRQLDLFKHGRRSCHTRFREASRSS